VEAWQQACRDVAGAINPTCALARQYADQLHRQGPKATNAALLQEIELHNANLVAEDNAQWPVFALAPIRACQRQFITFDQRWLTMNCKRGQAGCAGQRGAGRMGGGTRSSCRGSVAQYDSDQACTISMAAIVMMSRRVGPRHTRSHCQCRIWTCRAGAQE
jgi:hypothetical protein